jgi:hypothetical protein
MTAELQQAGQEAHAKPIDQSGLGTDIIIAIDVNGQVIDMTCNRPEILIGGKQEILGRNFTDFIPDDLASLTDSAVRAATINGISQFSFTFERYLYGTTHQFSCEIVGLGNRDKSQPHCLALINQVLEGTHDDWRVRAKNRLLFAVTQASEALMSARSFNSVMNEALYYIGNGIGVDRAYFFRADHDAKLEKIFLCQEFEWCSDFVEPQIDNPELKRADMTDYVEMWGQLIKDRPFKTIVDDMEDSLTKAVLAEQKIKSLLTIPIFVNGNFFGMLGFDDCQYERRWNGVDIAILKVFATIIAARVTRDESSSR